METKEGSSVRNSEQVKVVVRCRPMNNKEFRAGYKSIVHVANLQNAIEIHDPKEETKSEGKWFTFDAVYDFTSTQEQLYQESVEPIVESVLNGFNATIFAYGQTGTGKTFTMEGKQYDRNEKGVIPRSFNQIFEHITCCRDVEYSVSCSYIEIYQEEIKDLLDKTGSRTYELRGDQSSVYIKNLKSYVCRDVNEMEQAMRYGNTNRKTGATDMNEHSSRSHAIFTISVEIARIICDMKHVKVGKLNLVDLAGSERQAKSKSSGVRLKEATKINLSLSALANVISALSKERNAHIPYRDSKLTRFLQDSLGGNAKTLMIANIGPACFNYVESLNTLKYANRAKNIKNKPIINEDSSKDELIHKCQLEIERLRMLVKEKYPNLQINCSSSVNTNNFRINRKRNRNDLIEEEIYEIKEAIEDEESKLYNTCEKIEYLQELKDDVEQELGTDVLTYTKNQQNQLQNTFMKIQQIDTNKQNLNARIKRAIMETIELFSLSVKQSTSMIEEIELLHKTFNKLTIVKNKTSKIKEYLDNKLDKIESNHNRLLKRHGLNQIIIDNFIPINVRQKFMYMLDKGKPSETVSERLDVRMQNEKSKFNLNPDGVKSLQNCKHLYACKSDGSGTTHSTCDTTANVVSLKNGAKQNTKNIMYNIKFEPETPSRSQSQSNKFRNDIMTHRNDPSVKQYVVTNNEQPNIFSSGTTGTTLHKNNGFTEAQLKSSFRDSIQLLKNLLAVN